MLSIGANKPRIFTLMVSNTSTMMAEKQPNLFSDNLRTDMQVTGKFDIQHITAFGVEIFHAL